MSQLILIYGDSDTFKSTNAGEFADYQYLRTGLPTYLITADSGHGPYKSQIRRGIVKVWNVGTAEYPIAAINWASKGWWPKVIDPKTGFAKCITKDDMRPLMKDEIGGMIVEGLTRNAEIAESSMARSGSAGVHISAAVHKFTQMGADFEVQDMRTASGFLQRWTREYIQNFRNLNVDRVLMTAHEAKGEDMVSKKLIPGPSISGKASTHRVCGWFEFALHFEAYKAKGKTTLARRGWFQKHPDKEVPNVYWDAKLGCEPEITAMILQTFRDGYIPLVMNEHGEYVSGIHSLLRLVDSLDGGEALTVEDQTNNEEMRLLAESMAAVDEGGVVEIQTEEGETEVENVEVVVEEKVEPVVAAAPAKGGRKK